MKTNPFLIIFVLSLTSCGKFEENSLLKYSDENKSYQITKIEKNLNENDSLIRKENKSVQFYDSKNRLINSDNISFYFYNSNDKLSEIKSVYKREGKGIISKIISKKYFYDKSNNLVKIADGIEKENTIKKLKYDKFGKLTSEINRLETINYEYSNDKVSKKTIIENNEVSKISEYQYNKSNQITIEDWVFSGTNKMRTYYKYYPNKKLFSERDSSFSKATNPNQVIETLTEYYYDKKDSIIEIRQLERVLSDKEFKLAAKTKFEYKKE